MGRRTRRTRKKVALKRHEARRQAALGVVEDAGRKLVRITLPIDFHVPLDDLDVLARASEQRVEGYIRRVVAWIKGGSDGRLQELVRREVLEAIQAARFDTIMPEKPSEQSSEGEKGSEMPTTTPREGPSEVVRSVADPGTSELSQPAPPEEDSVPPAGRATAGGRKIGVWLEGVLSTEDGEHGPEHHDPPRKGAEAFLGRLIDAGDHPYVITARETDLAQKWLAFYGMAALVEGVLPADRAGEMDAVVDRDVLMKARRASPSGPKLLDS